LEPNACKAKIATFVGSRFGAASAGGLALSFLILVACFASIILGCAIKSHRNIVHKERRIRHATGQGILEPEEIAMLKEEFDKIDIDGSGDISRDEFSRFYNSVMGTALSPRELEEFFDKLDADGNGTLSFEEFTKVYVPHREAKRKSSVKPKNVQQDSDSDEELRLLAIPTPRTARQAQKNTDSARRSASPRKEIPSPFPAISARRRQQQNEEVGGGTGGALVSSRQKPATSARRPSPKDLSPRRATLAPTARPQQEQRHAVDLNEGIDDQW
jgi:hypothetical protein